MKRSELRGVNQEVTSLRSVNQQQEPEPAHPDPIRDAVLTVPDDLASLRAVLDRGHNLARSDCYALLNYIDGRAS